MLTHRRTMHAQTPQPFGVNLQIRTWHPSRPTCFKVNTSIQQQEPSCRKKGSAVSVSAMPRCGCPACGGAAQASSQQPSLYQRYFARFMANSGYKPDAHAHNMNLTHGKKLFVCVICVKLCCRVRICRTPLEGGPFLQACSRRVVRIAYYVKVACITDTRSFKGASRKEHHSRNSRAKIDSTSELPRSAVACGSEKFHVLFSGHMQNDSFHVHHCFRKTDTTDPGSRNRDRAEPQVPGSSSQRAAWAGAARER
eukprot:1136988-Pelagomonas_calceolata.AAC.4